MQKTSPARTWQRPIPRFRPRGTAARRDPTLPVGPPPGKAPLAATPAPAARLSRRGAAWLFGSLLLHAALMTLLLVESTRPRPSAELPAPSIDIVFEGGQPERSAAEPPPGIAAPPSPPAIAAAPSVPAPVAPPPTPAAPPVPAPPTIAAPPPVPAPATPPTVATAPPLPTPTPPVLPPSVAAPLPPPPAAPPDAVPVPEPPPPEAAPEIAETTLPPGPPLRLRQRYDAPPTPRPAPAPPQRQAAPAMPPGVTYMPGGVQLGSPAPPAGRPQGRGLDLTVDPRLAEGEASSDPSVRVSGAQVGADWRAAFRRWLDQNMRYPMRAIELGESGTVRVQVIAEPDGRVRSVRLTGPSVSPSLNFGTTFPFSGATLPSFPPPADPNGVTIDLTVNYRLIRR